jgi:hypothetical protein
MKALEEVLDAVIFILPEEVFEVPGCSIKVPFVQGVRCWCQARRS